MLSPHRTYSWAYFPSQFMNSLTGVANVHIGGILENLCFYGINWTTTSPLDLSSVEPLLQGSEILHQEV